jgi:hypothetical protein
MAMSSQSNLRSGKRATPAERAVELKAHQVQMKADAAKRRDDAAATARPADRP